MVIHGCDECDFLDMLKVARYAFYSREFTRLVERVLWETRDDERCIQSLKVHEVQSKQVNRFSQIYVVFLRVLMPF